MTPIYVIEDGDTGRYFMAVPPGSFIMTQHVEFATHFNFDSDMVDTIDFLHGIGIGAIGRVDSTITE